MHRRTSFVCVHLRLSVVVIISLVCAGCQPKSSLGRVHGTVTLDDKPLEAGNIVTLPSAGRGAHAIIKDGKFELGTDGDNDGAVIGLHKVAVIAQEPSRGTGP